MVALYFVIMSLHRFTFNKSRNLHVKNLPQAPLVKYFDFFPKTFLSCHLLVAKLRVWHICEGGLSVGVYSIYSSALCVKTYNRPFI